jgi:hypothetical protein
MKDFKQADISRLIITIVQRVVGGNLEIQCGETATYADVLFGFLCWADAFARENKKVEMSVDKVLADLHQMYQNEAFHEKEVK